MAVQASPKTLPKSRFAHGIASFALYLLALIFGSIILPLATGLSLPIALLACGVASFLFLLISRGKMSFFLTANLIFLPGILLIMDEESRRTVGSVAWNQAMGGLVVAVWVAGLLYIVLASLVRLFGVEAIRRYFPPRIIGPLVLVAGLTALPSIFETMVIAPYRDGGASVYKSWILFAVAFAVTVVFYSFKKSRKVFRLVPAAIGLVSGFLVALLLDGIELWFLSKDISQTLLVNAFVHPASFFPLFLFQDAETYFGFWSYVHFDVNALLAIVPLVLIAFGVHLTTIERIDNHTQTTILSQPGVDRTLVGEGICTMAAGLLSGMPVSVASGNETMTKKEGGAPWIPLVIACVVVVALSLFGYGAFLQSVFPMAIVGGTLFGILGFVAFRGGQITLQKNPKKDWKEYVLVGFIILLGLGLSAIQFINSMLRIWDDIVLPGGLLLSPLSLLAVVAFLLNLAIPFEKKTYSV